MSACCGTYPQFCAAFILLSDMGGASRLKEGYLQQSDFVDMTFEVVLNGTSTVGWPHVLNWFLGRTIDQNDETPHFLEGDLGLQITNR